MPPSRSDLSRYVIPMLGVYPARGCPFLCNFCSVIKIAGRRIRSQSIATTLASLRAAKAAGVRTIMFTSDNFNKYPEAEALLKAMVEERLGLDFFVQCDTQIAKQEHLVALLGRAGCFQMFVGVESFNRQTLLAAHKGQNRPETYRDIVRLCREHGFTSHFSNIIGFPQDTEQRCPGAPGDAARDGPDVGIVLHPLPDSRHRAVRRFHGSRADHRDEPRPLRHDLPDLAPPLLLARAAAGVAVQVLSQVLFVAARAAEVKDLRSASAVEGCWRSRRGAWPCRCSADIARGGGCIPCPAGSVRVRLDGVDDFLSLRKATFGFELAPLPRACSYLLAESELNQVLSPRGPTRQSQMANPLHNGESVLERELQHYE